MKRFTLSIASVLACPSFRCCPFAFFPRISNFLRLNMRSNRFGFSSLAEFCWKPRIRGPLLFFPMLGSYGYEGSTPFPQDCGNQDKTPEQGNEELEYNICHSQGSLVHINAKNIHCIKYVQSKPAGTTRPRAKTRDRKLHREQNPSIVSANVNMNAHLIIWK